jgi:hypothetical protein
VIERGGDLRRLARASADERPAARLHASAARGGERGDTHARRLASSACSRTILSLPAPAQPCGVPTRTWSAGSAAFCGAGSAETRFARFSLSTTASAAMSLIAFVEREIQLLNYRRV